MELDLAAVKAAFAQYSGETADESGTERQALCARLCSQCTRQVEGQARPGLSQQEAASWQGALEELAAAEAFYQLLLTEEAVTPQSIAAGDLKLTGGGGSQRARQLALEKRRAASPALEEPDFYFGAAKGGGG